jgi:phosphate uptake regulator
LRPAARILIDPPLLLTQALQQLFRTVTWPRYARGVEKKIEGVSNLRTAIADKLRRMDFMIAEMSLLTGGMVYDAARAITTGDMPRARRVQHLATQLHAAQERLEFLALRTAALKASTPPVQHHLLRVNKIATSIARIGENADMMAMRACAGQGLPPALCTCVATAAINVQSLLEQAIDAYIRGDGAARQSAVHNTRVLAVCLHGRELLNASARSRTALTPQNLTALLTLQQLELMGEHVLAITHWLAYGRTPLPNFEDDLSQRK